MNSRNWMWAASISALCTAAFAAQPALAQTGAAPATGESLQLEEIVVTARKVEENLQAVPVAVTAFTGEQLERQGATQFRDIARTTPGFSIREGSSTPTAMSLTIRGQTQTDILATLDPSVGTYVDGYYWARAYGLNSDLLDVQSVQVLKGPQGTLFGRNTTGGALLIQTNDPNFSGLSGKLSALYGRFAETTVTGVVNIPIIADKVALRVAAVKSTREGYARDVNTGIKYPNKDNFTGRAKLLLQPTEELRIVLSAEQFHTDTHAPARRLIYATASGLAAREAGGIANVNAFIANISSNPDLVAYNERPQAIAKTNTYTATTTYDAPFATFKYIVGRRIVNAFANADLEGSTFPIHLTRNSQKLRQTSHELQATGNALDNKLKFAVGVFYFTEYGPDASFSITTPSANPRNTLFSGTIDNKSEGVYGQATYQFTDQLSVTGGLRYSKEEKGLFQRNRFEVRATGAFTCQVPTATPPECLLQRSDEFTGTSYTFGADYKILPDAMVYAKTSRGFRGGGQNLRAASLAGFQPFRPEVATDYEIGLKSEWLDRRLRFNAAAYWTTVKDIQRTTLVATAGGTTSTILANAGKARMTGLELETSAVVTENLTLSANYGLTNPTYLEYRDLSGDRRGERFAGVAENSFTVAANYFRELPIGTLTVNADYSWTDDIPQDPFNNPANPDNAAIIAASTAPAAGVVNARASLRLRDRHWELGVFGRNLGNNRDTTFAQLLPPPIGYVGVQQRDPTTYGVTVTYYLGEQ